eukprot:5912815-Heterocapsa_arctica.AAC.1
MACVPVNVASTLVSAFSNPFVRAFVISVNLSSPDWRAVLISLMAVDWAVRITAWAVIVDSNVAPLVDVLDAYTSSLAVMLSNSAF